MNKVGKNIKRIRLEKGKTLSQLAEMVDLTDATIQRYESGVIENIPLKNIELIAKALGVRPEMITGWRDAKENYIQLPIYGKIPAGMPIEAIENIIETIDIPPEMINFSGEVVALKVSGDSMEPKFYENDIVLIQLTSDCESGQICAVYINGYDVTLKKSNQAKRWHFVATVKPKISAYILSI